MKYLLIMLMLMFVGCAKFLPYKQKIEPTIAEYSFPIYKVEPMMDKGSYVYFRMGDERYVMTSEDSTYSVHDRVIISIRRGK